MPSSPDTSLPDLIVGAGTISLSLGWELAHSGTPVRIFDLGYLREPYVDEKGRLQSRCPAEPVDDYVRKGGEEEETEGMIVTP